MQDSIVAIWQRKLGTTVTYVQLDGIAGDYDPMTRHIRIDAYSTLVEQRCTAMHEHGHAFYGHIPTGDPAKDAAMEAEADAWAARELISDQELQDALSYGRDPRHVAEILQVDLDTLHTRMGLDQPRANLVLLASVRVM